MLAGLVIALAALGAMQPPPTAIDGDALRAMALDAVKAAKGDDVAAVRDLDEKVVARWGDVLVDPVSISDAPTEIRLFSPYAAYRKSIEELLRRKQPIDRLPFNPVAIVIVSPVRVDAPDVTAIVVRRGGTDVAAVTNGLALRPITSSLGVTSQLHAGLIAFPLGAFAPGADVVVSAVVDGGSPLTLQLDAATLSRFR